MFTDISNFTNLSEGLEPKKVLDLLSEYQTKWQQFFKMEDQLISLLEIASWLLLEHPFLGEMMHKCIELHKANADLDERMGKAERGRRSSSY